MNDNFLNIYKYFYKLPELTNEEEVDFNFFKQCRQDYNFIVVAVYNETGEILLLRDLNKNIGWELIGGYVEKKENIENAVNRIITKEIGIEIDELEPIAILNNIFKCKNSVITHRGIAFMASSRGKMRIQPNNIRSIFTKEIPEKLPYQNKKVLDITKNIIENRLSPYFHNEIDSGKNFFIPHIIHKLFVNFIGRSASEKIKKQITKIIHDDPKSIIDTCCGDDNLIFFLEKKYKPDVCIANDISWKISSLIKNKKKESNVLFVNHNVLNLPFKEKFDLTIFKNSLHHIPKIEQKNLIENLVKISKQLIIVDISDPSKSSVLSKLWHWYYIHFLGDQGENFSTLNEVIYGIGDIAEGNNKKTDSGIIKTIKGDYFYLSLSDAPQRKEEVELKARIENKKLGDVKKNLLKLGAIFSKTINENDTYFTAPHRDFIKTKECLRIRQRENYIELTYKGPTTPSMAKMKQFWKPEINIHIADKEEFATLLEFLNFKKVAEVNKKREIYTLNSHIISIDTIKDVGFFVEIEGMAKDKKEREKILKENVNLLFKLGLEEKHITDKPYRDIVIEKQLIKKAH
jgi:adenylate cyclase, class 2